MTTLLYYLAALLLVFIGLVHSFLGERYILMRLFRRDNLPELFGDSEFTRNTLRFAWHLTTLTWFGFALLLLHLAHPPISASFIGRAIGFIFLLHFIIALVGSRGRHLSWVVFLLTGLAALFASGA